MLLTMFALGVLMLVATRSASGAGEHSTTSSWKDALDAQKKAAEDVASGHSGDKSESAVDDALIDMYKSAYKGNDASTKGEDAVVGHGYGDVGRGGHGGHGRGGDKPLPPEYPADGNYGQGGDMDQLPENLHAIVHGALVDVGDPADLFDIADAIDGAGYPLAAVRIKKKALRLIGETNESTLD